MDTEKQIKFAEKLLAEGLAKTQQVVKQRQSWYKANILAYGDRTDLPQTPEAAYATIEKRWAEGHISASDIIDNLKSSGGVIGEVVLSRLLGLTDA